MTAKTPEPLDLTPLEALEQAAECLKTLAHPHRLRIVQMLLHGRYTVGELAQACGVPSHMASEHLRLMQRSGFLSAFFALRLIADDPTPEAEPERGYALPSLALVLLCLVPIGALLIEGAMMEWSALLMREDKGAGPFVTALTFGVFALAMALTRLAGDRLAEQFGPRAVILRSGLVMGFETTA